MDYRPLPPCSSKRDLYHLFEEKFFFEMWLRYAFHYHYHSYISLQAN
jgi:hypothetical protein